MSINRSPQLSPQLSTNFATLFPPPDPTTAALIPHPDPAFSRYKEMGKGFVHGCAMVSLAFSLAGSVVNVYEETTPRWKLIIETCEYALRHIPNPDSYEKFKAVCSDGGLYRFYATLFIALGLFTMTKAGEQVVLCLRGKPFISEETTKKLDEIKEEIISTMSIAILATEIPIDSKALKSLYAIAAALPLPILLARKYFPNIPEIPTYSSLKDALEEVMDPKLASFVAGIASFLTSLPISAKLGMSLNAWAKFLIWYLYDAKSPVDFPLDKLAPSLLAIGFFCGLLATWGNKINAADKFIMFSATFYLLVMPLISTITCFNQNLENNYTAFLDSAFAFSTTIASFFGIARLLAEYFVESANEINEQEQRVEEIDDNEPEIRIREMNDDFYSADRNSYYSSGEDENEEINEEDIGADDEVDFSSSSFRFSK